MGILEYVFMVAVFMVELTNCNLIDTMTQLCMYTLPTWVMNITHIIYVY